MIKKIVLFAILVFPVVAFAQETQKIAYMDQGDVIVNMPEYKLMMDSLKKDSEDYDAEIKSWTDEYSKKMADFQEQQDTLNEAIKIRRYQDLEELRQRAANFQQYAQQKLEELQQALFAPIIEKFQKAVDEVGKENNFLYIIDSQAIRFTSSSAVNATTLVKKKLGIQ